MVYLLLKYIYSVVRILVISNTSVHSIIYIYIYIYIYNKIMDRVFIKKYNTYLPLLCWFYRTSLIPSMLNQISRKTGGNELLMHKEQAI